MKDIFNFHKPGMRSIKTAISVLLCIVTLKLFNNNSPFYACIATVITMQNSMEGSIKAGVGRMIGTIIGATIAIIFLSLFPQNIMVTFLGIILVIYTANFLKVSSSTSIACIVYLAIMVNIKDTTPLNYSIMRVFETFLGIIMAMLVNKVIYPPQKCKSI